MSLGTSTRTSRLSTTASLALLASLVVSFLAASAVPTPLYAVYQAEWGFSPITTTVVFGVYAVAVLVALLALGRLSDHVGRKPVLLAGLLGQVVSMVVFATAAGVPELLAARVIQGVATGAALGAIGAALLDLDKVRGSVANSVAPGAGTASGALLSGLVVQFLPAPTYLVYLVAIGVFALQTVGVLLIGETVTRRAGARRSLVPQLALPRSARRAVLGAAPALFAVWALAGFYGALGPSIVHQVSGSSSIVLGGLSLFVLAGVAAVAVYVLREADPHGVMALGVLALVAGVATTLAAIDLGSTVLFFLGTAVAGVGFGSGFQGGIRTVIPLLQAHERAGVLSVLYVVSYLGMGVPAVVAGFLVVHGGGLLPTSYEYGVAVMALALLALTVVVRRPEREPAPQPVHASAASGRLCTQGVQ
ncbi:MAG: major facilitator superfamily permease [Marmoricola sp.]|jgi:predicted MFS family arabinose efflux permease|nr:major facilitator superfamily permease [Marmoricola sp.]